MSEQAEAGKGEEMSRGSLEGTAKKDRTHGKLIAAPRGTNAAGNSKTARETTGENGAEAGSHKGAKKALRQAVKAEVKKQSREIARKLVHKAVDGDIKGAAMVLSLMDKERADNERKRHERSGPSWAELLASEPEWDESLNGDPEEKAG